MAERSVELKDDTSPRVKPPPVTKKIPVPFTYHASDDGTDENLLILFHGLGDTHTPFGKLGRQLKLPQTATLALRAPEQIPYLYEEAYQWYETFDPLGEKLRNPNPVPTTDLILGILRYLTSEACGWPSTRIHLFGFAQGGTIALEVALKWWKVEKKPLASVVSVSGPLLSYPTIEPSARCPTHALVFHRPLSVEGDVDEMNIPEAALTAIRKGYSNVRVHLGGRGGGMPSSKEEWGLVMRFWSERLHRRQVEGVYEVMSGMSTL